MRLYDSVEHFLQRVEDLDRSSLVILLQRLARERELLHTVFNTIREGILVIDPAGRIDYANQAAGQMLGFDLKDASQATLWKRMPDLARTLTFNHRGEFQETSGLTRELEISYPQRQVIRMYILPLRESHDDGVDVETAKHAVILANVTHERTTTKKEIENERVASLLMLSAGVAHELGNPLNSLHIHLQLVKRQLEKLETGKAKDRITQSIEVCVGEVDRLDGIITHFLQAVRPRKPDMAPVDLMELVEEVLQVMRPEIEGAGIRVDVDVNVVPVVDGDRNLLKQVLFNVLKNARQAMESGGGSLRIVASADDEFVFVRVGDTGEGMDQEQLRRVFQPYFTTKKEGHGLGMMIVERIMRDHGGQVGMDSRPGLGTVVTLQFPQKHRRMRMLRERNEGS